MSSCKHTHLLTQLTFGSSSTTAMSDVFDPKELEGLMTQNSDCEFILGKVWKALNRSNRHNPLFQQIFSSVEDLHEIANQTKFKVADGLVDKMTAESPPDPNFWKTLPHRVDGDKSWGNYVVHMEKEGEPPRDYFGSATAAAGGFDTRLPVYDYPLNLSVLPKYVAEAVREGYSITHVGILLSGPPPTPGHVPIYRIFYVATEATLAMWFWTFRYRRENHANLACCGWDLEAFQYEGLCSHSPLHEGVRGDFDLTAKQLEIVVSERKATSLKLSRIAATEWYYRRLELDPYAMREVEREGATLRRERSPERQAEMHAERQRTFYANNPGKKSEYNQTHAKRVHLSKKYYCDPCGANC
jgi:hypothetical protein